MCTKSLKLNNDTTAMATATNEACIGYLDENYYFMGKE